MKFHDPKRPNIAHVDIHDVAVFTDLFIQMFEEHGSVLQMEWFEAGKRVMCVMGTGDDVAHVYSNLPEPRQLKHWLTQPGRAYVEHYADGARARAET